MHFQTQMEFYAQGWDYVTLLRTLGQPKKTMKNTTDSSMLASQAADQYANMLLHIYHAGSNGTLLRWETRKDNSSLTISCMIVLHVRNCPLTSA